MPKTDGAPAGAVTLTLDERADRLIRAAHTRFQKDVAPLSLANFMEVCVVEHLGRVAPDLYEAAFGIRPGAQS